MNAYIQMMERQQREFNEFPMKFAFSDKQFTEGMQELGLLPSDTSKVYAAPGGGFYRKEDAPKLHEMMTRHSAELHKAIDADNTGEGFIYQMFYSELINHEYGYTKEVADTLDSLGFTWEDILADKRLETGLKKATSEILRR